jgi:membrane-bound serine protease (ClpP class)
MKLIRPVLFILASIIILASSNAFSYKAQEEADQALSEKHPLMPDQANLEAKKERAKEALGKVVYVIPIEGDIEKGLAFFVYRSIKSAEEAGADAIILEIKTFGGGLEAAIIIRDYLIETKIPTYSFINKTRAISAGALIALATKHIYMAEGSSIGDALPVTAVPGQEMKEAPRKVIDYLRKEFKATAERNGHPTDLAEGMVDPEFEIEGLKEKGTILALTTKEAEKYKLISGITETFDELLEAIGLKGADVRTAKLSTAEKIARLLSSPTYSWIFLAIGVLGVYIEIKTPGFGLPGIAGIIFLSLFFWGHNIAGFTGYEEVAIFILGVILLIIEIFVIPGFGFVGTLGLMCIILSLILAMFKFPPKPFPFNFWRVISPMRTMGVATIFIVILGYFFSKLFPKTSIWSRLKLSEEFTKKKGFVSADPRAELIGRVGLAIAPIRPAGTILIDERRFDVISEGDFIDSDTKVIVTDIKGAKVTVRPYKED